VRGTNAVLGATGLAVFLAPGKAVPRLGLVEEAYLPPVARIAGPLGDEPSDDTFWTALGDTLTGWALGLAVAVSAGIVVCVVVSIVPYLREATASTIEFLRPIPSVALVPLAVLLYGSRPRAASSERT
jgi:ABC-type nitrate/sulfonate/bicarbonate transport system permease component